MGVSELVHLVDKDIKQISHNKLADKQQVGKAVDSGTKEPVSTVQQRAGTQGGPRTPETPSAGTGAHHSFQQDKGVSNVVDPEKFQFGFGRRCECSSFPSRETTTNLWHRICPGRHFANDALFLAVASVLHVFNIGPPMGEDGKALPVAPKIVMDYLLS